MVVQTFYHIYNRKNVFSLLTVNFLTSHNMELLQFTQKFYKLVFVAQM